MAIAQDSASIAGVVRDASGAGIEEATVRIRNTETGTQRELATDDVGRFHAPCLAVGTYELSAEKSGFRPERKSGITLLLGQRGEFTLTLQVGDAHQTIEVTAKKARKCSI